MQLFLKAILGTLFVALAAQLTIPLPFVPITGQSLAVLIVGFFLGWRGGFFALLIYLLIGAAGAPVFAEQSSGLEVLTGNSGGYLFGFLMAATLIGYLAERNYADNFFKSIFMMTLGTLVILFFGVSYLSYLYDFEFAVQNGLLPFIEGATVKMVLAAIVAFAISKLDFVPNN